MAGFFNIQWGKSKTVPLPVTATQAPIEVPAQATGGDMPRAEEQQPEIAADFSGGPGVGGHAPIVRTIYSGEKNFGEMGPALKYVLDHNTLGIRSWQLDMDNETAHLITKQLSRWVIGTGLKLQAQPKAEVLAMKKITLDPVAFNKKLEALWQVYANKQPMADYANRVPLHKIAKRVIKNAMVWGDVLVVLRVSKDNIVKTQVIDGQHVSTPTGLSIIGDQDKLVDNFIGFDYKWTNGNRIRNGVEIDETGQHVAYHVRTSIGLKWERIPAQNRHGMLTAFLVYGNEYRLDNTRGVPTITPNMESTKQLEDYTSATVGSAVERQKIPYFIEHEVNATGTDPRGANLAKVVGAPRLSVPTDVNGNALADTIAATTNKMTFNMAPGSKISSPDSRQELYYKEFHDTRVNSVCATAGIPPEVATQLYGSSYSASRAATNGFQYSLNIDRDDFGNQFYQIIYNLQLWCWIFAGVIEAPGYMEAWYKQDAMILAAYHFANWIGNPVPQIDQKKEVEAIRLLLGLGSKHLPLIDFEQAAQQLGYGDASEIFKQYADEMRAGNAEGIEKVEERGNKIEDFDDGGEDEKGKPAKKMDDKEANG